MPVDQELQDGRVVFDCPTCKKRIAAGPPSHTVSIGSTSGVTVDPRIMCPNCHMVLGVQRGEVTQYGKRVSFPMKEGILMPEPKRKEEARVVTTPKPKPMAEQPAEKPHTTVEATDVKVDEPTDEESSPAKRKGKGGKQ